MLVNNRKQQTDKHTDRNSHTDTKKSKQRGAIVSLAITTEEMRIIK